MKAFLKKIENYCMAIAFAEENQPEIAKELFGLCQRTPWCNIRSLFSDTMVAVAYAENNCPEYAREIIESSSNQISNVSLITFLETVGLKNRNLNYGIVAA